MQKAIKEKRVLVGMNKEQVIMAMGRRAAQVARDQGRPRTGGLGLRQAPGKITFVTFNGDKVIKVKDSYAGLGSQVSDQPVVADESPHRHGWSRPPPRS